MFTMNWYYKFLARQPYLVVLAIGILSLACIIVSFTTRKLPDFSDPTLGFEARGTDIGQRLTAWKNLLRETRSSGKLVADPNDLLQKEPDYAMAKFHPRRKKPKKRKKEKIKQKLEKKVKVLKKFSKTGDTDLASNEFDGNDTVLTRDHWDYGKNTSFVDNEDQEDVIQLKKNKWMSLRNIYPPAQQNDVHIISDGYFCESPTNDFSHFVVERIGPNSTDSLFEINSLLAMCQLEQQIQAVNGYDDFCQKEMVSNNCCRAWSLPNYVALFANKSSCFDIDAEDVAVLQSLLLNCFEYFHTLKLSNDCTQFKCRAPVECTRHNAIYNIFHYLTDMNFVKVNATGTYLKHAMIFVPIARSVSILPFFYSIEKSDLKNELVQVAAMDLGLKNALFDECLLSDGWLVGLGAIFVMVCMWLYTTSLFVTAMTVIAVLFSLGIAYFIYTLIFEISFFPFMNLLAVVVIIGIGADDAFIFVKIWQCTLAERIKSNSLGTLLSASTPNETLYHIMATTLKHAALSMFVTSLTTAGAFYASYISSITSVKCFGVFAGTAVISNYILMVTWLPAIVPIMEWISCNLRNNFFENLSQKLFMSINRLGSLIEGYIIGAVINFPMVWVLLLGIIGIISSVLVLYWPGLQLPESPDFQLFVSDHPFELYEAKFKDEFWFEKTIPSIDNFKLPLRFVWGILPVDRGDYMNPQSRGELYFDNNFNISSKESQEWLLGFCERLKEQSFYQTTFGMLLPNCFIENFISHMNRVCIDSMDDVDRSPCCETSNFPFEPHIFDQCLPQSISSLYATPREFFIPGVAGPKFARTENVNGTLALIVKALVVEYESNFSYTMSYTEIKEFVTSVQTWFDRELLSAPQAMQGGWFVSELDFFDLQDTLSRGTVISIGVAMLASLLVLLFVTLNILISLYAVVTVSLTIFTTVAVLILLGWKLNILESVSVSTAIGLAVDFSLHYGIHYRFSSNSDRASSTTYSLSRIIGPTAMAAITTGAAGALMLPSNVLAYIQIGIFLVVVMSTSWIYSTFFLMSLLRLIGPQHGFMQFSYPTLAKRTKPGNGKDFNDRTRGQAMVAEHLLTPSSSAVGDLINSESHELDSLTSNSLSKPASISETVRPTDFSQMFVGQALLPKDYRSPSADSAITVVLPDDM